MNFLLINRIIETLKRTKATISKKFSVDFPKVSHIPPMSRDETPNVDKKVNHSGQTHGNLKHNYLTHLQLRT